MGVFDGHNGPDAAEYCSKGLLHHILAETMCCSSKTCPPAGVEARSSMNQPSNQEDDKCNESKLKVLSDAGQSIDSDETKIVPQKRIPNGSITPEGKDPFDKCILKNGHILGYERAQARFARRADPPTFGDVNLGLKKVRGKKSLIDRWFCSTPRSKSGGTTACTLSLVSIMMDHDMHSFKSLDRQMLKLLANLNFFCHRCTLH